MDYFYVIVLSIAIIILILLLTLVGISLRKHNSSTGPNNTWPPVESTCPDYWTIDPVDSSYCIIPNLDPYSPTDVPRNTGAIYSKGAIDPNFIKTPGYDSNGARINFNDPYYTVCNTQKWSKKWGLFWDGYTNYNGNC